MSTLHGTKNEPPAPVTTGNLSPGQVSTNQKQPLPWICGEEKVALLWIGQLYDQFTLDAPAERPGKK